VPLFNLGILAILRFGPVLYSEQYLPHLRIVEA
jgi:hypothetical protein